MRVRLPPAALKQKEIMTYNPVVKDSTAAPPGNPKKIYKWYYKNGETLDQIANRLQCSRQRIARWMEYWNMSRRNSMEAMKLRRIQLGETRGPNWKGGSWYVRSSKTWFSYAPYHPKRRHNGGVPTHLLIAEKRIGRYLLSNEIVHHLNADRDNNSPENLCVMTRSEHMILHRILGNVGIVLLTNGHFDLVMKAIKDTDQKRFFSLIYKEKTPCVSGEFKK